MPGPFDETKHPRGGRDNRGEFAAKPGGPEKSGGGGTTAAPGGNTSDPSAVAAELESRAAGMPPDKADVAREVAGRLRDQAGAGDNGRVAAGELEKDGQFLRPPQTAAEAKVFAEAVRKNVKENYGKLAHRCGDVSASVYQMFPGQVETWSGVVPTEQEAGGFHKISKVGDHFIDVTGDQFGLPRVQVFTDDQRKSDPAFAAYRDFRRDQPAEESSGRGPHKWLRYRLVTGAVPAA